MKEAPSHILCVCVIEMGTVIYQHSKVTRLSVVIVVVRGKRKKSTLAKQPMQHQRASLI